MTITDIAEPRNAPARSRASTRRRLIAAGTELFDSAFEAADAIAANAPLAVRETRRGPLHYDRSSTVDAFGL